MWALSGYSEMVLRWAGPQYLRDQFTEDQAFEFVWEVRFGL